jgi:hypothetical protein
MAFPVNSVSTITPAVARINRVLQRSTVGSGKTKIIDYGAVYACRKISGSSSWSQHSWGNAIDLFPERNIDGDLAKIAHHVVLQATHRTIANRGRRLDVAEVIDHQNRLMWTPAGGWRAYGGTTGPHIHVTGSPVRLGTPACA